MNSLIPSTTRVTQFTADAYVYTVPKHTYSLQFSCDQCDKPFAYLKNLKTHHKMVHKIEVGEIYKCEEHNCKYRGKSMKLLKMHRAYFHFNKGNFDCKLCKQRFRSQAGLDKHIESYHKETQCRKGCRITFRTKKEEIAHVRNKHSRENGKMRLSELDPPPPCPKCGKKLAWKNGLRDHIRNVHKGDSYGPIKKKKTIGRNVKPSKVVEEKEQLHLVGKPMDNIQVKLHDTSRECLEEDGNIETNINAIDSQVDNCVILSHSRADPFHFPNYLSHI